MSNDYADLERLAQAATPGPWAWQESEWFCPTECDGEHHGENCERQSAANLSVFKVDMGDYQGIADNDAAYIAAASPEVVLALLADNARLRAALAGLLATGGTHGDKCVCVACEQARAALDREAPQ